MPVRDILLLGHPLLWQPAAQVIEFGSRRVAEVIADLGATLADFRLRHHFGRAIAAPQIGHLERIIFVDVGEARPLINPQIVERSEEMMELWDDCFSFPDLMVRVRRHYQVTVNYSDEHGNARRWEVEGSLSELLQHEIDHLDGILATDRAIDPRGFAMRTEVERRSRN